LNSGAYSTRASVLDFSGKHFDVLSESMCDDARDIQSIPWLTPRPDNSDVEVLLQVGLSREQTLDSCRTIGGTARSLAVRYTARDSGYVPTPEAETQLFKLIQTGTTATSPDGLRPERRPLNFELP